jgi:hypothetical protein
MDSLCADLKRKNAPELRAAKLGKEATWRLSVDGFGVAVGSKATREACERLAFLNLPGKVSLDDPDAVLRLIVIGGKEEGMEEEDIGDETEAKKKKSNSACSSLPPSLEPSFARRRFVLGLEVGTRLRHPKAGESYRKSKMHARDRTRVLSELALPKRPYIGKRGEEKRENFFLLSTSSTSTEKKTKTEKKTLSSQVQPRWTPRSPPSCATSPS